MAQSALNFSQDEFIQVTDSHVTEPSEVKRLASQNARMLERLKRGPATNYELAQIALKYTSRIDNLRKAGYDIQCERHSGGGATYRLVTK